MAARCDARPTCRPALRALARDGGAEAVIDLSGDPVLDGEARFALAAVALDAGLEYRAPGMVLEAPRPSARDGRSPWSR